MIPADAPPSFDGHRETTFATVHAAAPFYSVLIRVNPDNPSSTTDFVCDLCTEMPKPTDDGKTYTFKIRDGVKFHDGSPLTAARRGGELEQDHLSRRKACSSARAELLRDGRQGRGARPDDRGVPPEIRHRRVPAGARRSLSPGSTRRRSSTRIRTGTRRTSWAPARSSSPATRSASRSRACAIPTTITRGCRISTASSASIADKQAVRVDAIRGDRAAIEFRGLPPSARDELEQGARRQDHRAEQRLELRQPDHAQPQEEAVRRRAGAPRADAGDRPVARRAGARPRSPTCSTVGGIVFPGSPLAATKEELQKLAGFWPDIEKSRAEARRLLKEAGAEGLQLRAAEPQRRPAVQISSAPG